MRLKEIRESLGISQKGLAEKLDVSPSNIYNYETGRTEPSAEMLCKLSHCLNVSIDYLIGNDEMFMVKGLQDERLSFSQEEKDLIKYYRGIEKPARLAIFNTAKSFYNQAQIEKKTSYNT